MKTIKNYFSYNEFALLDEASWTITDYMNVEWPTKLNGFYCKQEHEYVGIFEHNSELIFFIGEQSWVLSPELSLTIIRHADYSELVLSYNGVVQKQQHYPSHEKLTEHIPADEWINTTEDEYDFFAYVTLINSDQRIKDGLIKNWKS